MTKTKVFLSTLFFLLFLNSSVHAEKWYQKIKWPKDRVQDEVQLLPFGFEIKLNFFLQQMRDSLGVSPQLVLIQSLEGKDLDSVTREYLQGSPDGGETLLFFLSLSDRQFKIVPHPAIQYKVDERTLDHLVRVTIPSFKKQSYPLGIQIFLQNLVYEMDPQSPLTVPNLTEKKGKTLNNLLFLLTSTLIILILGHKIRFTKGITFKNKELVKKKFPNTGVFW